MKKQFQSLTEKGRWLIATLTLLFTLGIGQMWGANTPAGAGEYQLTSSNKPGGENKFYKLGDGVYIHRRNNSSQDNNGLKSTSTNTNGVAVYVNSSMNLSCLINKSSSKNAVTVQISVYTLSNGSTAFGSFESGTQNSTTVSVSLSSTPTYTTSVSFAKLSSNAAEAKSSSNVTLAAGYYYIVPAETSSVGKTYLKSITLTNACSTEITTQPSGANLAVGDANPTLSVVATNAASYAWKESSDGTSYNGSSTLASTASFTPSVNNAAQTKYYYCEVKSSCDGTTIVNSNIVTVNVLASINYYTVTLNPAGGTIVDATGWTLNAGNYEKEVAEGTNLTLPTFTKENRNFKTWRKAGPADVASPVTVNSDLTLTAIWTATVENVIYSWEGAEGGATEVGGTAVGSEDGLINIESAGYYTLKINGKADWSSQKVEIILSGDEKVKTGDKIVYWGFYNKSSSANARPKMRDGNTPNAQIFDDGTNLPNLYSGGDPAKREFTVPADINTNKVQITRSQTGSNTWISKLQIIRPTQVEESNLLTVTFNSNGGSSIDPVVVASGQAVAKPADPTKAHNRFNEWQLAGSAYNFATPVTGNITLTADWTQLYTVTFANGGGSGDAPAAVADKAQGETFAVPANTFTAPEGKEFDKWNDGTNDYAPGATYTVGTANVTLTAVWKQLVAKYTVIFKDGETELGTKLFDVASNPSDADINKTKPLFTFAAWQKDEADIALDAAFWATVAKDATVTLTARWAKAYATSYDMEAYAVSDGASKSGLETALTAAGYAYTNINGIDNGHTHNYTYDGMKYKTNDGDLSFNVVAGKVVEVKTGHLPSNDAVTMYINGVADATVFEGADENIETHKTNYFYSAAEALYRLDVKASKGTCAVKAVTIRDPYQVTFNVDGGDPVSAQYGHPSITLPSASKGTDSFLGWFIGEDKIGEAGDSYTPTANVELVAHWEAVSTDARLSSITFSSDAGTLVPAFDPEVTSYTYTMPYGTAAIPTITGATSVNAKAQDPIIGEAAAAWSGTQTIQGVAQSGDKKTYTITMAKAPKDGVCLIKGNVGNNTFVIDEEASLLSGTPSKSNVKSESSTYETLTGWKFNSRPAHLGLTLSEGTFQEGDVVEVFVTSEANGGGTTHKMRVFDAADATPAHVLAESAADMVQGANRLVLPATSTSSLYLHRGAAGADYENWNPYVAYFAVYRPMNPMLTAMTIDGRTVTINEDAKTATVTIPYESDLANLTIAKTIVWNAPATENSIVVNGGSAWVIGENTYKLTDKDGDATTYTITVARDVLKHTVSFNTHGGSAVASVEIEHNTYLTSVPNDPSKEDYIFQYWSLTDGGEEVDVTTVQINEDKEFHAVWVSDGGIKLLDGSTVNHTNFITAVTATETVEFKGNTVNYAKFSGTCGSVNNVKDLTRVIAYNATTNKTKIRISAHNNSTSGRSILVKGLVEGADAAVDLATIALGNKEDKVSDWIEFDNAANRTIYIMVGSSAGDVYFTQVKVIESGETPMKQVGEVGYSLNLNKGRFFGLANTDLAFEGLNARLSGDYTALNSGYAKLNATSMSFTVASDMNLVVTTNNSKTYYVTKGAAGTDNETAKSGLSEFDLTAGTWYITAGSSEVQFTNIAFELPKAAKPVVAAMDDVEYCQGSAIDALTVSATVSDGGTMLYQWYKDNEIIAGAEAETYQPTADGEYYVEVVNTKAGYQNSDAVQSNTITVTGYAATVLSGTTGAENWPGEDATISVTASGKNLHYAWYTCDDAMGTNPVAVDPAVDAAELNVTIAAADTYYKVVVSGDCGSAQEAVITVVARQAVELQDVTGDMSWDFSKANDGSAASSNLCNDEVLANVHGIVNISDFKSDNIKATANKFSSGKLQASMIMFHTTVGGIVTVVFSHTGNNKTDGRALVVNGTYQSELSHNQTAMTYKCYVPAGDVVLTSTTGDGGAMLNFTSVDFKAKAEADYTRNVSNNIGTLCVDHNVLVGGAMGATFYQIASRNELYNDKIDFEEVLPNEELKAGEPYIFHSNTGKIELFYGETVATEPVAVRGMIGSFVNTTLDITEENKSSIMYIAQNKLWNCEDLVVSDLEVVANRAYIVMSDVPTYAEYQEALQQQQNPAPRRRVTLGRNAEQVATGIGEVQGDKVQSTKVLIDGHIYILRGEKMFDAKGQLVK